LVLEDILDTTQRPKMEDFESYIYFALKMLYQPEKNSEIIVEQISLILGNNFVISFQESEGDVFNPIRDRIRSNKGRIRKMGSDYLAYALIDAIVDNYFVILEKIGDKIESIENKLIEDPSPENLQTIHYLKREMIFLRKSVWPLREVISVMQRSETELICKSTEIFLRDVYDHTIQVIDTIETYRDMISGMLDIYMSSVSNKMNEVMKVLTIFAAIFIPLTFIAGIYGMNFEFMPELHWEYGYLMVWIIIFVVGLSMIVYFRRKNWL
jgi:magnesium transporter